MYLDNWLLNRLLYLYLNVRVGENMIAIFFHNTVIELHAYCCDKVDKAKQTWILIQFTLHNFFSIKIQTQNKQKNANYHSFTTDLRGKIF